MLAVPIRVQGFARPEKFFFHHPKVLLHRDGAWRSGKSNNSNELNFKRFTAHKDVRIFLEQHVHENGGAAAAVVPSTTLFDSEHDQSKRLEERIERAIFDCRFLTLLAVVGSLAGSLLCFVKGSLFVLRSFVEYFNAVWHGIDTEVILLLVEAVDIYLMGTVMLIFGMGLYELFVSTLEIPEENLPAGVPRTTVCGSNLFGLFRLQERPKWLEIRSLDELKTKLGHVIVMILLVGMFEKSKKIVIHTGLDLVCLSASILFSSGCLFLLSKLHRK